VLKNMTIKDLVAGEENIVSQISNIGKEETIRL